MSFRSRLKGTAKFFQTSLGVWALGTVVIGSLAYWYSERLQCVQTRDADRYLDVRNHHDLRLMWGRFLLEVSRATKYDELKLAGDELSPRRPYHIFSENKDKTDAQIYWEHLVIAHRWRSSRIWSGTLQDEIGKLKDDVFRHLLMKEQDGEIPDLARRAKDLMATVKPSGPKPNPVGDLMHYALWPEWQGSCDLGAVVTGDFRRVPFGGRQGSPPATIGRP